MRKHAHPEAADQAGIQESGKTNAERADGNIDDETYARLHADYTARAARVIHRLDGDPVAWLKKATAPLPHDAKI